MTQLTRKELLQEFEKIEGTLSLDDRRPNKRRGRYYYGALYLITSKGYFVFDWRMYDNSECLTPEEYEKTKTVIASEKIDWDVCSDKKLLMVNQGCKPGIVYYYDDCSGCYQECSNIAEEARDNAFEFVSWNDVKTANLRIWLERITLIKKGYACLR